MRRLLTLVFCAIDVVALRPALAVDYKFSGIVDQVGTALSFDFPTGTIVSGHLSLTPKSGSSSQPDAGYYNVSDFYLNIGGHYPITASGDGELKIFNDRSNRDEVNLNIDPVGNQIVGRVPDSGGFILLYNQDVFASTNLVPQFIPESGLTVNFVSFNFILVNNPLIGQSHVYIDLTDFSIVPEPSSIALAAVALMGLIALGRRTQA
jgi:hypothetical protein